MILASGLKYVGVGTTALGWTCGVILILGGGTWLAIWLRRRDRAAASLTADGPDPAQLTSAARADVIRPDQPQPQPAAPGRPPDQAASGQHSPDLAAPDPASAGAARPDPLRPGDANTADSTNSDHEPSRLQS